MTVPDTIRKVPPWTTLLGVVLFGVALYWLRHVLAQYRLQDILAHVHAIPTSRFLAAVALACTGYGCLTLYDALGLRFAGVRVPYPRLALISFMGYAIGHNWHSIVDGFKGGLSAENYISISKTSRATATRDLQDLVEKGALTKTGELRHTRYPLNIDRDGQD